MNPFPPPLDEHILDPDPVVQFHRWFKDALAGGAPQPEAMTLATATKEGVPSARVVLLKLADAKGFVFYTNYRSRKGRELEHNPVAALCFFWPELTRSVRVEGTVSRVSLEESEEYFSSRPPEGQLSSLTSAQSEPISGREELDRRYDLLAKQYEGKAIPRPEHWGGYRVSPNTIEFWQHRFARLNDRVLYTLGPDGQWSMQRLQP